MGVYQIFLSNNEVAASFFSFVLGEAVSSRVLLGNINREEVRTKPWGSSIHSQLAAISFDLHKALICRSWSQPNQTQRKCTRRRCQIQVVQQLLLLLLLLFFSISVLEFSFDILKAHLDGSRFTSLSTYRLCPIFFLHFFFTTPKTSAKESMHVQHDSFASSLYNKKQKTKASAKSRL